MTSEAPRRGIRSYVLRQGRMTEGQKRALSDYACWLLPYDEQQLDFNAVFAGRDVQPVLEIGFGNGEALLNMARNELEHHFLGIEVHAPGVGHALQEIARAGLRNVRLMQHDAVEILRHQIPEQSLARVHIYFPDPWPKKKHHKRRLIQEDFVALLASRLSAGGDLFLATDWQEYADEMLRVLSACPDFANVSTRSDGFIDRPSERCETHFERRGLQRDYQVRDLHFKKQ